MELFENKINQARSLYDEKKYDEAAGIYLSALQDAHKNDDKALVWAELCWLFYKKQAFQQCLEAAESVFELNPDYEAKADLLRLAGYSASALGDLEKGRDMLLQSLDLDSDSAKQKFIYYELGKMEFAQGNYADSEDYLEKIESQFKETEPAYWLSLLFFRGFNNYYLQNLKESEHAFKLLVENAAENVEKANGFYGLAYIAFDKKEYLETINMCERVTNHNPNFFDMESVGFLMTSSFYHLGRTDVFLQYCEQMEKAYPEGRYYKELLKLKFMLSEKSGNTEKH